MPNIKSAKKRVLVAKKKAAQNKAARSALKTVLKKANTGDPAAVKVAIKKVDQAVASHILHKKFVYNIGLELDGNGRCNFIHNIDQRQYHKEVNHIILSASCPKLFFPPYQFPGFPHPPLLNIPRFCLHPLSPSENQIP